MEDNDKIEPYSQDVISQTLSITSDQLQEYVAATKCDRPCAACGATAWLYPNFRGEPNLLLSSNVRDVKLGEWHFQMICEDCGTNRLISASHLWTYFFKSRSGEA